jgi:DNA-binding response OmpR family regulator
MKKRILVVDDDANLRSLLCELLEDEAYEIDTAPNGVVALQHVQQCSGAYRLILLDLVMPQMDGREFLQELRQRGLAEHLPIIVLSAESEAICKVREMGACSFLEKPFDLDRLLELVSRYST